MWPDASLFDEIRTRRSEGRVHCGVCAERELPKAADAFELDPRIAYDRIEPAAARHMVLAVLHRDLAYDAEIMSLEDAARLTDAFFAALPVDCAFFTNAALGEDGRLRRWTPATGATFDTGVLALSSEGAACLWVEDED